VSTKFEIIHSETGLVKTAQCEKSQIELFGNVLTDSEVNFLKRIVNTYHHKTPLLIKWLLI
jgi:hypothetical protein